MSFSHDRNVKRGWKREESNFKFFCEILIKMFVSIDEAFMTRVEKCYKTLLPIRNKMGYPIMIQIVYGYLFLQIILYFFQVTLQPRFKRLHSLPSFN